MSLTAEHLAREKAFILSINELREEISKIQNSPVWKGDEFEDVRMRHKTRTRLRVYQEILQRREWNLIRQAAEACRKHAHGSCNHDQAFRIIWDCYRTNNPGKSTKHDDIWDWVDGVLRAGRDYF